MNLKLWSLGLVVAVALFLFFDWPGKCRQHRQRHGNVQRRCRDQLFADHPFSAFSQIGAYLNQCRRH